MRMEGFEPPRPRDLVYSQASQPVAQHPLGVPDGSRTRYYEDHNLAPSRLGSGTMQMRPGVRNLNVRKDSSRCWIVFTCAVEPLSGDQS